MGALAANGALRAGVPPTVSALPVVGRWSRRRHATPASRLGWLAAGLTLVDDALDDGGLPPVHRGDRPLEDGHDVLRPVGPRAVRMAGRGQGGVVRRVVEPGAHRLPALRRQAVGAEAEDRKA